VGAAEQRDVALASLGLGADAVAERPDRGADEVHLPLVAGQDPLAHLLGLVDRLELVGDERHRPGRRLLRLVGVGCAAGEAQHGNASAKRQDLPP